MNFRQHNSQTEFTAHIVFLWDKFAARGFVYALLIMLLMLLWFSTTQIIIDPYTPPIEYKPIILLNFGEGDGTGRSKGNLSKEGAQSSGAKPENPLEDAGKIRSSSATTDPQSTSNLRATETITETNKTNKDSVSGRGKAVGAGQGTGTGLGDKGTGPGKGMGLGDIEWGGGGNRTVLNKVLPPSPPSLDRLVTIRIKFSVLPDGTVGTMKPMTKGDPALEGISLKTLKKWKFNRLESDVEMSGIITFTFKPN